MHDVNIQVKDCNSYSSLEFTAVDCLLSKLSCVYRGYVKYPGINQFVDALRLTVENDNFKLPMINRGYYIRIYSIREAIKQFLKNHITISPIQCNVNSASSTVTFDKPIENNANIQIVNFGCGLDPIHLYVNYILRESNQRIRFVDVDTSKVIEDKLHAALSTHCNNIEYHGVPLDVCNKEELSRFTQQFDFENRRTLVICECLFSYLQRFDITNILSSIFRSKTVSLITFDVFNCSDRFGKVMEQNFCKAGTPLGEPKNWLDINDICQFYRQNIPHEFIEDINVKTLYTIYNDMDVNEKKRIENIELLDEIEEIILIEEHAAVCKINI